MIVVNIETLLARRSMTLAQLAEVTGIPVTDLTILKNGRAKAIRVETMNQICQALHCQPGDLLEWKAETDL